jgi:hypothetical protein
VLGGLALASSDGVVMVAWASRAAGNWGTSIHWSRWIPGQEPTPPRAFAQRSDGEPFAPSLTGIGGGSFLLTYTSVEGGDSRVLAQVIDAVSVPFGAPLTISTDHPGASWGATAVVDDGHGAATFLAPSDTGFELMATPISCQTAADPAVATAAK